MAGGGLSKGASAGAIELNVVPLVDLCCLLVLFFILTTQISSANLANLQVPDPVNSVAKPLTPDDELKRIVVNVVSTIPPGADSKKELTPGQLAEINSDSRYAKEYQVGGRRVPCEPEVSPDVAKDKLLEVFNAQIRSAIEGRIISKPEEFGVEIRGDARVMALYMNPILQAAAEAQMNKISITAVEGKQ